MDIENFDRVYLYDLCANATMPEGFRAMALQSYTNIETVIGDVTETIEWRPHADQVDLIANFAAVHREPGHADEEYFRCNVLGAENVCDFASKVNCRSVVFSSSISPYGISEHRKTEDTLPVPVTAYGSSKLVAEKIHREWLLRDNDNSLLIIRPGVVFGPGEGGNVSRLIKAIKGNYFFYMANRDTRKAGIYVKELCKAVTWVRKSDRFKQNAFALCNLSMDPAPSVEEYATNIKDMLQKKLPILSVPVSILLCASYFITLSARLLGFNHPFDPVRLRKMIRSNDIVPKYLIDDGYDFEFDLRSALEDWRRECPEEW